MIFYDFKVDLTQKQSVERLVLAFEDEAPSRATIYRWFKEFRRGSLKDEGHEGRPCTALTTKNVSAVRR